MRFFLVASFAALAFSPQDVSAAGRRRVANLAPARMTVPPSKPAIAVAPASTPVSFSESPDALDEVNQARAARGLPPYARDPNLTAAALAAARYRASVLLAGHVMSGRGDFQFLPAGTSAAAAGCAALEPSWGFQACAQFERWTYAGAAWVIGRDGRRYSHLFVR